MFGRADDWQLPEFRGGNTPGNSMGNSGNASGNNSSAETFTGPLQAVSSVSIVDADSTIDTSSVNAEIRKRIHELYNDEESHREIARQVGLTGRKYNLYCAVCKEEKIEQEKRGA